MIKSDHFKTSVSWWVFTVKSHMEEWYFSESPFVYCMVCTLTADDYYNVHV